MIAALEPELDRPFGVLRLGDDRLRLERSRCRATTRSRARAGCAARPADPFLRGSRRSSRGARPRARALRAAAREACWRRPGPAITSASSVAICARGVSSAARSGPISSCQAPPVVERRRAGPKTIVCALGESSWKLLAMTTLPASRCLSAPARPALPASRAVLAVTGAGGLIASALIENCHDVRFLEHFGRRRQNLDRHLEQPRDLHRLGEVGDGGQRHRAAVHLHRGAGLFDLR